MNNPIGVFDSGLGGLTVVKALKKELPNEDIVYFGDTGRVPYGTKSNETIIKYATQDEAFLLSKNVKLIVAACGTVSSVAHQTGDSLPVPFMGVVNPAAEEAVKQTKNKRIGIIGTNATISSNSYTNTIRKIDASIETFSIPCPLFVQIVEEGIVTSDPELAKSAAKHYLNYFNDKEIDTLILGCTHFPIMSDIIGEILPNVKLVNIGNTTATKVKSILKDNNLLNINNTTGKCEYYVSDTVAGFSKQANIFLGENINDMVKHIDLEK